MPVLDGFEATRRIRQAEHSGHLPGHLPIIALTANVSTDSRTRCIEAGADHFLPKPLISAELHECIQRFM
jgi:CheY-like chemotaxis protein